MDLVVMTLSAAKEDILSYAIEKQRRHEPKDQDLLCKVLLVCAPNTSDLSSGQRIAVQALAGIEKHPYMTKQLI